MIDEVNPKVDGLIESANRCIQETEDMVLAMREREEIYQSEIVATRKAIDKIARPSPS